MYLFPYAGCERSQIRKPPVRREPPKKEVAPTMVEVVKEAEEALTEDLIDTRFRALLAKYPLDIPTMPKCAREVMFAACRRHMVHPNCVCGKSQEQKHVRARREIVLNWKQDFDYSLAQMGRYMRKDHTSILYALRKAQENPANYDVFTPSTEASRLP